MKQYEIIPQTFQQQSNAHYVDNKEELVVNLLSELVNKHLIPYVTDVSKECVLNKEIHHKTRKAIISRLYRGIFRFESKSKKISCLDLHISLFIKMWASVESSIILYNEYKFLQNEERYRQTLHDLLSMLCREVWRQLDREQLRIAMNQHGMYSDHFACLHYMNATQLLIENILINGLTLKLETGLLPFRFQPEVARRIREQLPEQLSNLS